MRHLSIIVPLAALIAIAATFAAMALWPGSDGQGDTRYFVYAGAAGAHTELVVVDATGRERARFPIEIQAPALRLAPDGVVVYFEPEQRPPGAHGAWPHQLLTLDLDSGERREWTTVDRLLAGAFALSADGHRVAYLAAATVPATDRTPIEVHVFDFRTGQDRLARTIEPAAGMEYRPQPQVFARADDGWLIVRTPDQQWSLVDGDDGTMIRLDGLKNVMPSPTGRWLIDYEDRTEGRIERVIDPLTGTEVARLERPGRCAGLWHWSPADNLAVVTPFNRGFDISEERCGYAGAPTMLVRTDGTPPQPLSEDETGELLRDWSEGVPYCPLGDATYGIRACAAGDETRLQLTRGDGQLRGYLVGWFTP